MKPIIMNIPSNPGRIVNLRLEIPYVEFDAAAEERLRALASEIADCSQEEVQIVDKSSGCTNVRIEFPSAVAASEFVKMLEEARTPAAQELLRAFAPSRVVLELDPVFLQKPPEVIRRSSKLTFSWLHFSDAHVVAEAGKEGQVWNQNVVIGRFFEWIDKNLPREYPNLNAVFFTGDVASRSTREEYRAASDLFSSIRSGLKNKVPIFVIPGNHDVDWDALDIDDEEQVILKTKTLENATDVLLETGTGKSKMLASRFSNYLDFENKQLSENSSLNDSLGKPLKYERPGYMGGQEPVWYVSKFHIDPSLQIGIAGLNSALFSVSKNTSKRSDQERLIISEVQLDSVSRELASCDIKIAIVHHPLDSSWYLREDRHRQREFMKDIDFILNGHEHDLREIYQSSSEHPLGLAKIAAGAIYESRQHANSFNIVSLNFHDLSGSISAWRFAERRRKWVPDVDLFDDGTANLELSKDLFMRGSHKH